MAPRTTAAAKRAAEAAAAADAAAAAAAAEEAALAEIAAKATTDVAMTGHPSSSSSTSTKKNAKTTEPNDATAAPALKSKSARSAGAKGQEGPDAARPARKSNGVAKKPMKAKKAPTALKRLLLTGLKSKRPSSLANLLARRSTPTPTPTSNRPDSGRGAPQDTETSNDKLAAAYARRRLQAPSHRQASLSFLDLDDSDSDTDGHDKMVVDRPKSGGHDYDYDDGQEDEEGEGNGDKEQNDYGQMGLSGRGGADEYSDDYLDEYFVRKPKSTRASKTSVLPMGAAQPELELEDPEEPASPAATNSPTPKSAAPQSAAASASAKKNIVDQATKGNEPYRVVAQCMIVRDGLASGKKVSYFDQFTSFMPKASVDEAAFKKAMSNGRSALAARWAQSSSRFGRGDGAPVDGLDLQETVDAFKQRVAGIDGDAKTVVQSSEFRRAFLGSSVTEMTAQFNSLFLSVLRDTLFTPRSTCPLGPTLLELLDHDQHARLDNADTKDSSPPVLIPREKLLSANAVTIVGTVFALWAKPALLTIARGDLAAAINSAAIDAMYGRFVHNMSGNTAAAKAGVAAVKANFEEAVQDLVDEYCGIDNGEIGLGL